MINEKCGDRAGALTVEPTRLDEDPRRGWLRRHRDQPGDTFAGATHEANARADAVRGCRFRAVKS
jgi:hypothetical protein